MGAEKTASLSDATVTVPTSQANHLFVLGGIGSSSEDTMISQLGGRLRYVVFKVLRHTLKSIEVKIKRESAVLVTS